MSRSKGATADTTEQRVQEALGLLVDGFAPASVTRHMAATHKVHITTARRWTAAAKLDMFDAPMTEQELEFGIALQVERLELISDRCREAGDTKMEISAIKASAKLREDRLKSMQRSREYIERIHNYKR